MTPSWLSPEWAMYIPSSVPCFAPQGPGLLLLKQPGLGAGRQVYLLQNPKNTAGCPGRCLPGAPPYIPSPEAATTHVARAACVFPVPDSGYVSARAAPPSAPHTTLPLVHGHLWFPVLLAPSTPARKGRSPGAALPARGSAQTEQRVREPVSAGVRGCEAGFFLSTPTPPTRWVTVTGHG